MTCLQGECAYRHAEVDEEEIGRRLGVYSQQPPSPASSSGVKPPSSSQQSKELAAMIYLHPGPHVPISLCQPSNTHQSTQISQHVHANQPQYTRINPSESAIMDTPLLNSSHGGGCSECMQAHRCTTSKQSGRHSGPYLQSGPPSSEE